MDWPSPPARPSPALGPGIAHLQVVAMIVAEQPLVLEPPKTLAGSIEITQPIVLEVAPR